MDSGDKGQSILVPGAYRRSISANGFGWTSQQALRFLDATRELDYVLEQPSATLDGSLRDRPVSTKPMVLDESIDCLQGFLRIHAISVSNVRGLPEIRGGTMDAPTAPGRGLTVLSDVIG